MTLKQQISEFWSSKSFREQLVIAILSLIIGSVVLGVPAWFIKDYIDQSRKVAAEEKTKKEKEAERQQQAAARRKQICNEFAARYEAFKRLLEKPDRHGAVAVIDLPGDIWTPTDPSLARQSSTALFLELHSLAKSNRPTMDSLSDWPPSPRDDAESIRQRVATFMADVYILCP